MGLTGWVNSANFPHWYRRPIKVLSLSDGGMVAEVASVKSSRTFYTHHLDCGREWQLASGAWIPESDERVRRWLVKAIADIDAGGTKVVEGQYRAEVRDDLLWVLRRNGWGL